MEGFRLSPQQRSLWRHAQERGFGLFRAQVAALIKGATGAELEAALGRAVARHEILRTHFHRLPGVSLPVQVIDETGSVHFRTVDSSGAKAGPEAVDRAFGEALARPLEGSGPDGGGTVLEATWFDFGADSGALLLGLPGGLADRAALELLIAELLADLAGELGAGAAGDGEPDEGPLQYADLSEWQNELLEGDDGREGVAAWRRMALPSRPPLDLPVAARASAGEAHGRLPETVERTLAPEVAQALRSLERDSGVALAHLGLAAWLVVLWRRSGQEERLLGVSFDGRSYEELEAAMGLFERVLPVSLELAPEETVLELARRIAAELEPFDELQHTFAWDRALGAASEAAHSEPVLGVSYAFDDHRAEHAAGGRTARVLRRSARTQPVVLEAVLVPSPSTITLAVHHDPGQLAAPDAARIAAEYESVLAGVAAGPERPVAELDPLGPGFPGAAGAAERRAEALAPGLRAPSPAYPDGSTVHALIEAAAREGGGARTAVVCGDRRLSYGELIEQSGRVAEALRARGLGPDRRVALCCGRSTDMLVGLLGILRSGAGYVPIDPGYPRERIEFMIGSSECPVLLTQERLAEGLPATGAEVLALEAILAEPASPSAPAPQAAGPEHLAYVIYTSGSTGTPKGVEVTHRNLVHSTAARGDFYGGAPRVYLVVSSYAFDSSVTGIFWALTQGATLVLPEEGSERDVVELARLIEAEAVDTTLTLPSLWNLLLDHGGIERLRSLETVIVAGEACTRDLVEKHRRLLGGCRLVNEYGPTEGTVWSTAFDCSELGPSGPVPIGAPIARVRVYLLDERRRPVPLGAPGELWIAGAGVARGYLGSAELTAERFLPDAFHPGEQIGERPGDQPGDGAGPGGRMYRTGDLARWLPDGTLEFLGRVDHQVKIRGYRVELGEIEDALASHPAVAEAVAVAREDSPGDQRLVAYVTASDPASAPDGGALLEHLGRRLPEYMLPQAFVVLEDLPRTPNGKLDRKALPAPQSGPGSLSSEYVEPATALERAFCEVWREVLETPRVGLEDDFFELGGHSILAVRLAARLTETFGLRISLRALFENSTVRALLGSLAADPDSAAQLAQAAELMEQVEGLSDDELDAALSGEGDGA